MDKPIQTGASFAQHIADSVDYAEVDKIAAQMHQSLSPEERQSPAAVGRCLVRSVAYTAALLAHDRLAGGVDRLGAALGRASVGLARVSEELAGLAIQHAELVPYVDTTVEDLQAVQQVTSEAWERLAALVTEMVADATGLGRKVVTGQSQLSPTSVRELLDIAEQMVRDGEAHPLLVFLYGGGEELTVRQLVRLHDNGKFPVVGIRSPAELDCERYVSWAQSRAKVAMARLAEARDKHGYPTQEAIQFVYNAEGKPL